MLQNPSQQQQRRHARNRHQRRFSSTNIYAGDKARRLRQQSFYIHRNPSDYERFDNTNPSSFSKVLTPSSTSLRIMFTNSGMMNFLDTNSNGSSNGLSRNAQNQAPPPLHLQPVGLGNLYPNGGHQLDLNHLWNQVQELSGLLASNRETTQGLVRRADQIKTKIDIGDENELLKEVNGDGALDLEIENTHLRQENYALTAESESLSILVSDYESVLERILDGLRNQAQDNSLTILSIHQSYANQLAQERQTNVTLRQEAADTQGRLAGMSRLLREMHENEFALDPDIVIEELKAENAALREALGMPPGEEEDVSF